MGKLSYKTLRENVVDEIRMKILNRELEPGTRIIEQSLSEELGVSRGPIREALRQLEQEGMIEYTRNVGCSVRKMTLEDFYEIYLLRSTYEILAVKLYKGDFAREDIEHMEEILEQMREIEPEEAEEERGKMVSLDGMLHRIIVEKAGCERLTKSWTELEYGNVVSFDAANKDQGPGENHQYSMHKQLVDVCRSGNLDQICEEISNHYMVTVRQLIENEQRPGKEFKYKVV